MSVESEIVRECVCGGSVDRPNPDCERCHLVAKVRYQAEQIARYEELCAAAANLRRGCTCRYDDRCDNCDRIIRVSELAKKLLTTPADAKEEKHHESA